ncbi:MAG: hypothetical protein JOZ81_27430 [Chloroflexi bacterium]|nr:hypothetical protein [Chloroflexota bacterium]
MIRRWSPPAVEAGDDRRIRDYVLAPGGISESAASLADKLGVSPRRCRRVLDDLVKQGVLRRHEFTNIAPMYCRFPTLARPPDPEARVSDDAAYTGADAAAGEIEVGHMQGAPSPAR